VPAMQRHREGRGVMTYLERKQLEEHDRYIRRPVSELFPKRPVDRVINCRGCGKDFLWGPSSGMIRVYCTSECKSKFQRAK
jgi:hypothetical protein